MDVVHVSLIKWLLSNNELSTSAALNLILELKGGVFEHNKIKFHKTGDNVEIDLKNLLEVITMKINLVET